MHCKVELAHHFVKNIRGRGVRNSIEYDCKNVALFSNELSNQLLKEFSIIISSKWHRTSFSHSMNLSWDLINFYLDKYEKVFLNLAENWGGELLRTENKLKPYF